DRVADEVSRRILRAVGLERSFQLCFHRAEQRRRLAHRGRIGRTGLRGAGPQSRPRHKNQSRNKASGPNTLRSTQRSPLDSKRMQSAKIPVYVTLWWAYNAAACRPYVHSTTFQGISLHVTAHLLNLRPAEFPPRLGYTPCRLTQRTPRSRS